MSFFLFFCFLMTMFTKKKRKWVSTVRYNNKKTETASYTEFQNVLQCINATDRPIYLNYSKKYIYSFKHHFRRVVVTYMVLFIKQKIKALYNLPQKFAWRNKVLIYDILYWVEATTSVSRDFANKIKCIVHFYDPSKFV